MNFCANTFRGEQGRDPADGGRECEWRVRANPDGTLQDLETRKEYACLRWEADPQDGRVVRTFNLGGTKSFCVAGSKSGKCLVCCQLLDCLELNSRLSRYVVFVCRQRLITYGTHFHVLHGT